MSPRRRAGVLLHPSSLPGPYGIGELGPAASEFVDFLAASDQQVWQMLPLVPVDEEGCPYQSCSSFAGDPLLISVDGLLDAGMVDRAEIAVLPRLPGHTVDHPRAAEIKSALLGAAHRDAGRSMEFDRFREREGHWLDDYALYRALSQEHGPCWARWPVELAEHRPAALHRFAAEHTRRVDYFRFEQFVFAGQLDALRARAHSAGVQIMGDIAMFVGVDSADVWAHRELFQVDDRGVARAVAGFPPDVFSRHGQVWGNALYSWDALADTGFGWWIDRLRRAHDMFDIVRLDHFRGFWRYWSVPARAAATDGHWEDGPGLDLFTAISAGLGACELVAEDLGPVTPDVQRLRRDAGIAGMRVLQFAFGGDENPHLPHHIEPDAVVYTGTHDNDTTLGWWESSTMDTRDRVSRYLGHRAEDVDICGEFARLAFATRAGLAVLPMQDVLRLGSEARMNTPGRREGNWRWRLAPSAIRPTTEFALKTLTTTYGRDPNAEQRLPASASGRRST